MENYVINRINLHYKLIYIFMYKYIKGEHFNKWKKFIKMKYIVINEKNCKKGIKWKRK